MDVIENPPVRRAELKKMGISTGTVSDIIDWVQESMCGPSSPTFARFSPVTQEIGEDKGLVVGRSIMRSIVIADVSAVISGGNQWKCPYALQQDLSALSTQVQEIEGGLSSLDNYLPLSGGVLTGDLGLQKISGGIRPLLHNLVFDGLGHINHAVKASAGQEVVYDTLTFPMTRDGEIKTIATQEWTQGEISGKADISALSNYLPLSGGTL